MKNFKFLRSSTYIPIIEVDTEATHYIPVGLYSNIIQDAYNVHTNNENHFTERFHYEDGTYYTHTITNTYEIYEPNNTSNNVLVEYVIWYPDAKLYRYRARIKIPL